MTTGISRREFLKGSLAAVSTAALMGEQAFGASHQPPNIVLINADDLGYGDLSCYGSKVISTPNLDALAKKGMRFTDFHSCAPVCTPSRAGLMTGRYAIRSGMTRVLSATGKDGISDDEVTMAEMLKQCGYATACIGKWHLGHLPQFLPMRHGFDYYYGIPYSNNMGEWKDGYPNVPLMRGEEVIERPAIQPTLTQRYTEETIKFIKEHKSGPFFVYLPHAMPHKPWYASERFKGRSKNGLYGDVIEEIDWSVGEIMKSLKELGLEQNTLVIFTSDNGPNGGSAGILRGGKTMVFEGGMREPFIACWPERIPAWTTCCQPTSNLDLFPTIAKLAGGKVPSDRPIDGRDISRLLTVPGATAKDYEFFYFRTTAIQALRVGKWKLHVGRGEEALTEPELYNLHLDVRESRDVAKEYPDIAADLKARIERFHKELPPDTLIGGSPWSF